MFYKIDQAISLRSLLFLALTAALMWTLHFTYNMRSYSVVPATEPGAAEEPDRSAVWSEQREQISQSDSATLVVGEQTSAIPFQRGGTAEVFTSSTERESSFSKANVTSAASESMSANHSPVRMKSAELWPKRSLSLQQDFSREPAVLWPQDHNCSRYKLWFGLHIPGTWLLSFPRSGNTWTRYLLEAATGIVTGSVYHSKFLKRLGYLGEDDPLWWKTSLVIKTHSLLPLQAHPDYPVVAIIRNPARSILSFWNYWNIESSSKKFTGSIDYSYYLTPEFHDFVHVKLQKWKATYEYALTNTTRLHVVFYEQIQEDPIREIRSILDFLGVQPDEERLACVARHTDGRVKGAQKDGNPYTLREKMTMFSTVKKIYSLLRERGFNDLPEYEF